MPREPARASAPKAIEGDAASEERFLQFERFLRRSQRSTAYVNFTPRACQVLALARDEANRFNHNFVGTEHLLLGLTRLGQGTAVNTLRKLGLDLETLRLEVERHVGAGPEEKMIGNISYTPRVKKVLALAAKEAMALKHTYVGTEHILLGLLREGDGVAARVLKNLDVELEKTREEILRELDPNYRGSPEGPMAQKPESSRPKPDSVDARKRFDVYCLEGNQPVVYRNVLLKGAKKVFPLDQRDTGAEFLEIEQADGKTILIARASVVKFCEPGVTPGSERI